MKNRALCLCALAFILLAAVGGWLNAQQPPEKKAPVQPA